VTPDQVPFYGGTYFPPAPRHGMPSWQQVLLAVDDAWRTKRDEVVQQGERMAQRLQGAALLRPSEQAIDARALDSAEVGLSRQFDAQWGGWGGAPKFPAASTIEFLLARGETQMTLTTLHAMRTGGIYDQVRGGFSRYAVDRTWTVPHFEKMLYDNALLAPAYLHAWQVSGDDDLRRTCEETLDWMAGEMRGPEGGFFSALDADSEGVEGKYYVFTLGELREALPGDLAEPAIVWLGATEEGNFEGSNVLEARGPEPEAEQREAIRRALYAYRERRVRPGLDDKRLASWNALAIAAFAEAGAVLERDDLLDVARGAAAFVLDGMRVDGRLLRTWKGGRARLNAYLEDHAFLLEALLRLYEATFEERWFGEARALGDEIIERFADREHGGFFTTSSDHEQLVARRKDLEDHPIPSGGSSAAFGLLRLAALTGSQVYEEAALGHLQLLHELGPRHPQAFGHLLRALDFHLAPTREVALVGSDVSALARVVRARLRPYVVLAGGPGPSDAVPLLSGRTPIDGRAAAYVCERFACQRPVTSPDELAQLLG
jgi:uncharacterized protein